MMNPRGKTFIVDLDGTLCAEVHHSLYADTPCFLQAVEVLELLNKQGAYITIYTSRFECDRKVTETWLKKWNVPYDLLIMEKPRGEVYIDSRAVNMETLQTLLGI